MSWIQTCQAEVYACISFLKRPRRLRPAPGQQWRGVCVAVQLALLYMLLWELLQWAIDPLLNWAGLVDKVELPNSWPVALLWVGFLVPVLEELLFRAGLRRWTYNAFVLPALALAIASNASEGILMAVGMGLLSLALGLGVMRKIGYAPVYARHISRVFIRRFTWYFWGNAVLFGLLHVNHFVVQDWKSLAVAIALVPYITFGALLGYLRLRYGLLASITAHAMNNSWAVIYVFAVGAA